MVFVYRVTDRVTLGSAPLLGAYALANMLPPDYTDPLNRNVVRLPSHSKNLDVFGRMLRT